MSDALTDVLFWAQVHHDGRRTVLCSPENESRCKGYVDASGLAGSITVMASPAVRDDQLVVIDPGAIAAGLAEREQHGQRERSLQELREHLAEERRRALIVAMLERPWSPADFRITGLC